MPEMNRDFVMPEGFEAVLFTEFESKISDMVYLRVRFGVFVASERQRPDEGCVKFEVVPSTGALIRIEQYLPGLHCTLDIIDRERNLAMLQSQEPPIATFHRRKVLTQYCLTYRDKAMGTIVYIPKPSVKILPPAEDVTLNDEFMLALPKYYSYK